MPNAKSQSVTQLQESLSANRAHRYVLPNGLTVVHQEDFSAELASVQVWIKSGSIHEGQWLGAGLSHFLEHMLFKGTARRGPLDISREVHALGAYINAYTSYDRTVYYIDTPSESISESMDILADMCFHASLAEDGFKTERDVILREIAMGEDDPDRRLFHSFAQTCYRVHPYHHPVIGWKSLFEKITPQDLRAYYQSRYQPNNTVLVICGAIAQADLQPMVEKYFGGISRGFCSTPLIRIEPSQLSKRQKREYDDFHVERGMMGFRIPGLGHEDLPAIQVLANVIGHGQSSHLWQKLREELRLVHHISAASWTPGSEGLFWVSYTCDIGKRDAVEKAVLAVLEEAKTEVFDEAEVAKTVRRSLVSEIDSRKSMSGQASRLGSAEVVVGDLDYPIRHLQQLGLVKAHNLNKVASVYLREDNMTAVSLEKPSICEATVKAQAERTTVASFSEERLPNGSRLLLQPGGALPKVHLKFVCLGGPIQEAADKRGVTGVLATLLTRDTEKRTAQEVAELVESIGAGFSEFVGNNTFGLSVEVLPDDLPIALDLLEEALTKTVLTEDSFTVERDGQVASIREDEDEILDYARRRLRKKFFGEHPYGTDYMGEIEHLEALALEDVSKAMSQQLVGPNSVLSISGHFEPSEVETSAKRILNTLSKEGTQTSVASFAGSVAGEHIEVLDREQAVVLRAYTDVGIRHEDHLLSEVLDELFSGMASVLFNRVREERGLAYYIASSRTIGLDCGMFTFYAGTEPASASAVREEILKEIERVCSGAFEKDEIAAVLRRMSVRKRQSLQTPSSRAMQAALNALYGYPVNSWQEYDAKLAEVTAERLVAHAKKLFAAESAVGFIVGPEETV